jgi:4-amino-4-deoxy-L-arabinose transferase-like glycosyltransferase
MAASLALRLPGLESRPIWYDEAFSLLLAARPSTDVLSGTAADTMPPLYYLLLGAWGTLGNAIWQLRTLNVVLGVALVGLVFLLGRELHGRTAAGWAAMLAAISPLLVYHAQELRMYTLLTLSLAGYAYFYLLARSRIGRVAAVAWAGVVLAGTTALYTHNLAVFSILALDAFLLIRREWKQLARLAAAQLIMVVLFLPWLQFVPGQIQKIQQAFWTPQPGLLEGVQALVILHASLPLPTSSLVVGVSASLMAVVLTGYIVLRRLPLDWKDGFLACLILVPPVLLFLASYLMRPVFVPRAFTLSLVAYLVLAGRAIAGARPRALGWLLAGAFATAAAVGVPAELAHRTFPRSPFREATAYLAATAGDGDLVLHSNKLSFFPMAVYNPAMPQAFLADPPRSHNDTLAVLTQRALGLFPLADASGAIAGAGRIRYVVFQRELDEYALSSVGLPPVLSLLYAAGGEPERTAFNDLWIYDFDLRP